VDVVVRRLDHGDLALVEQGDVFDGALAGGALVGFCLGR
jgi:hypothetical protein